MSNISFISHGLKQYKKVWEYQRRWLKQGLALKKDSKKIPQQVLIVEHPHVYTMGKSANQANLLVNKAFLDSIGAQSFQIERGGDITYHGPGQLVVYPLLDLEMHQMGVKSYIYNLEQVIIDVLAEFKLNADRIEGKTGIWLDKGKSSERKIAAIGIKCSRHLTIHGLALNINTDLSYFNHIVPCGIRDKEVTSLSKELGRQIEMESVIIQFKKHFNHYFNK